MLVVQKKYHAAGHAFVLEDNNKTVVVLRA
jgi:hypothetical protein